VTAEPSSAKPVIGMPLPEASPEHMIQTPPSAPLAGELPVQNAATGQHPLWHQMLWHLKSAPVVDLSVIVGSQQAQDKHAARD
jgi:hypothetical protein